MKKEILYFNNAATTWPKPKEVNQTIKNILKYPFEEAGRSSIHNSVDYVESTRESIAQFFNLPLADSIVFTYNATDSLNILIHGFVKKNKKIHVITTDLEHNSVLRPLKTLEKEELISLSIVPFVNNKINLNDLKKSIKSDTRLLVLTHGSNVLGSVQDIKQICEYFGSNDIFSIIDGAQTAGQIEIDLSELPVDSYVFTGHKSLFGLPGTGGFFLRNPEAIDTIKQGGTGVYSNKLYQPEIMPLKFESGTPNYIGITSLYAGIGFLNNIGVDRIGVKTKRMTDYIISNLQTIKNITIHNEKPELPIISFNIQGMECDEIGHILATNYNIITRTGLHCAPCVHKHIDNSKGSVRLSLSYLNTFAECKTVVDVLTNIAALVADK